MKKEIKDMRIQCPYCKVKTWMTDRRAFMKDHDRPDGRRCQKARRVASLPELEIKPC
jgi:DNA-directed RNA polymerase subunit RPC12/RpoP